MQLVEKYAGVIVPPTPPKDAVGTGMMKFKGQGAEITPFIERRCAALDRCAGYICASSLTCLRRFVKRIAEHPVLRNDALFKTFLSTTEKVTTTTAD